MVSKTTMAKILTPLLLIGVPAGAYLAGIVQKPRFTLDNRDDGGIGELPG